MNGSEGKKTMETSSGARLNLAQIHMIKLQAERENGTPGEEQTEAKTELAKKKRQRIEVEAEQMEAAFDAASSKNPFTSALGGMVTGLVDMVGEIKDAVEDTVSLVSPELAAGLGIGFGVAFGGQLVAFASTLGAALPTIAGEAVRWGLTTMTVGKVVDATANVIVNSTTGSEANDLRKELDALDEQILALEAQVGSSDEDRASNDADRRRTKQQLRQTLDEQSRTVDAHMAAMRGAQSTQMMSAKVPAGVRAMQVAQANAAEMEARGAVAGVADMQAQMQQLREQALALRGAAADEQWKNEKTRAWLDFGAAWIEVAATVLSCGASSAATSGVSAASSGMAVAQSALSVGSAGLGIASAFITDEGVQEKFRQAEAMEIQAEDLQRSTDLAKSISMELRYEADQKMDRVVDSMEVVEGDTRSAKGAATALRAQNGMTQMRKRGIADNNQKRFEASGESVKKQQSAHAKRVDADGAMGDRAMWGQVGSIVSGATAAAGLGANVFQLRSALGAADTALSSVNMATELNGAAQSAAEGWNQAASMANAAGGLAQSGVALRGATVDDGADERRDAERAKLEADRHGRDARELQQQLDAARRDHRRSYDGQVSMARNLGAARA